MVIIDWIILGVIALSALIGFFRGFVKEALSLAVWLLALFVSIKFRLPLANLLVDTIEVPSVRYISASAILFFGTLLVGGLANFLLNSVIKATGLSGTNRLLGFVFGLLRGSLIIVACIVYLPTWTNVDQDPWWRASSLIPVFSSFETTLKKLVDTSVALYEQQMQKTPNLVPVEPNSTQPAP